MWKIFLTAMLLVLLYLSAMFPVAAKDDPDRAYCEVCASWKTYRGKDKECPWRGKWKDENL